MVTEGKISKMEASPTSGCLTLLLSGSSCPTRAARMPNVSCLLSDVGVMDVKRCLVSYLIHVDS